MFVLVMELRSAFPQACPIFRWWGWPHGPRHLFVSATRNSQHFMKPEGSLTCPLSSRRYIHFQPSHLFLFKIRVLSHHPCLDLPDVLTSGFLAESPYDFSSPPNTWQTHHRSRLPWHHHRNDYLESSTGHSDTHYAICSSFLLLPPN